MSRFVGSVATAFAIIGGVTLGALIVMVCVSITGRALIPLGLSPVLGDYEILEAALPFVIFSFLPLCQLNAGHATVDIFTSMMGRQTNRYIIAFWEIVFALVLCLIAWRHYDGLLGKMSNGSTSMMLQFPIWWAYAAALVPAVVAALVAIWSAADRVQGAITGRDTRVAPSEI